jgi:FMN phosphatase YigB (HAD superfamily)
MAVTHVLFDFFGTLVDYARAARPTERCVYVGDSYGADYRGATGAGLRAFLIDPGGAAPIPGEHRLASLLALEERIHAL